MPFSNQVIELSKNIQQFDPDCVNYEKFLTTEESEYSSLMPYASKIIIDIIKEHFNCNDVDNVLDMTSHIGCDAINFHRRFNASVICLENNEDVYKCLKQNLETFNNNITENYAVYCNCLDFISGFKKQMDFVYIDPPWGGFGYWEYNKIMLYLEHGGNKIPIYDVIKQISKESFTENVIIKAPHNFDFDKFVKMTYNWFSIKTHCIYKYNKQFDVIPRIAYYLIICTKLYNAEAPKAYNIKYLLKPDAGSLLYKYK
jgi:16S rRNA G966 N2-methylase RsmD